MAGKLRKTSGKLRETSSHLRCVQSQTPLPASRFVIESLCNRGVQIRSESDPNPIRSDRIRSDFGTEILISDRIGLEKLFRSRIGSDFVYVFLVLYLI